MERMEVIINDFAATTYVSIASNGDAGHRVDCASIHRNTLIGYYVTSKLSPNDTTLRQAYHIAERMSSQFALYYITSTISGC